MTGLWADVISWLLANNFGFDFSRLRSNDFDKFSSKSDSSRLKGRLSEDQMLRNFFLIKRGVGTGLPTWNICPYV